MINFVDNPMIVVQLYKLEVHKEVQIDLSLVTEFNDSIFTSDGSPL